MTSSLNNYTIEDTVYNPNDKTFEVSVMFDALSKTEDNLIDTILSFINELDGDIKRQYYQHKDIDSLTMNLRPTKDVLDRYDFEIDVAFDNVNNKEFFKYLVEDYFETVIGLNEALEEVKNGNTKSKSKV